MYGSIKDVKDPNADQLDEYHALLAESENHKEIDDRFFRVSACSSLSSRQPTFSEFIHVYCWLAIRAFVISVLYLAPLIVAWALL